MKAARIHRHGGPDVITIEDIARPEPGPGQVLVEVAATSFNPTETALRSGILNDIVPVKLPQTLGWDVAGTIAALGEGVRTHAVGDRVIGWVNGAAAEFTVAGAAEVVRAPRTLPLADAAALPLAGLTAWQAIETARLLPGERILVNGAGGGIGGFAVQLAKRQGAYVIATASPRSRDAVKRHGADEIVDYTTTSLPEADVVLNLVGHPDPKLGKLGSRIVTAAAPVEAPPGASSTHIVARNDPAQLAALVSLVDSGELAVDVAERRSLHELATLHRRSEAGDIRGKVIVLPS